MMVPIGKKPGPGSHESSLKISLAKLFLVRCPCAPLNNRVKKKKKVLNFFSMLGLMPSIKIFKQNKRENIVHCIGFTKPALKKVINCNWKWVYVIIYDCITYLIK